MFVSSGQFFYFIACIGIGAIFGLLISFYKSFKVNKKIRVSLDVVCSLLCSFCYIFISHSLSFPNLRLYMFFGVFLGMILYFKSINLMLAKILKKLYNIYKEKRIKHKHGTIKN